MKKEERELTKKSYLVLHFRGKWKKKFENAKILICWRV